jgi:tetratricopeptide (TPR) repeat protein
MTAVSFYRRVLFGLGITFFLTIPISGQQHPSSSLSEIYLLDLGVVIEPSSGDVVYNRHIESPSKEVNIRVKQVKSGTLNTIANQELLTAIDRINTRLMNLETSFHNEVMVLVSENIKLQQILTDLSIPALEKPDLPEINMTLIDPQILENIEIKELPIVKSIVLVLPEQPNRFDMDLYMAGMYAYQCGNLATALHCFDDLNLQSADLDKIENVLYWKADAYLQMHDYERALTVLDELLSYKKSDMVDDALVKKGLLYKDQGDLGLALNSFKKVVVGHPESEYLRLATLEIKRGELVLQ